MLLEIAGVPFELKLLDRDIGEQKSVEYRAINPRGKVPALRVDEKVVVENVSIQYYIADRFKHLDLAPTDMQGRLKWLSFLTWCSNEVHPSFRRFRRPEMFVGSKSAQADLSATGRKAFLISLREIDDRLVSKKWLFGDQFTTADAYIHVFNLWCNLMRFPTDDLPELRRHGKAMMEISAVARAFEREEIVSPF
jgi:glutathione S-transferase